MNWQKINQIETKNIETKLYLAVVFLILISLALFSAINLVVVIELRRQVDLMILDVSRTKVSHTITLPNTFNPLPPSGETATETAIETVNAISIVATEPEKPEYSNTFSEPFFSTYNVDTANTNLVLNENVTAMTFKPVYELKYEKSCSDSSCGLEKPLEDISSKIKTPSELNGQEIKNTFFDKLENNWVVSYIVSDGSQEIGYVYLFDGKNLKPLITNNTSQRIVTKYGRGGGSISVGGSDNQFMILYSGYEGFAYLYNKGNWQDLSQYFGLRVVSGGFKAKIIKGGSGNLATWYVCSDDGTKSKLIKLWQNNTTSVQGAIDISSVLKNQSVKCFYKNSREVNMVIGSSLQVFKDNGFDNSHNYYYQSNNINSYAGKKVVKIYFLATSVNADSNSYSFLVSADKQNWQNVSGRETLLDNQNLETAYLKANFSTGNSEYSSWFGGLENIVYVAQDRQ